MACKVVKLIGLSDHAKNIMMEEVHTLSKLDHKYIINYKCSFILDGQIAVITELLTGEDLMQRMQDPNDAKKYKPIDEKYRAPILYQIIEALAHCHQRGLVHTDLKPENVMFVHPKKIIVKIIDFGLCQRLKIGGFSKQIQGTFLYMAPEVINHTLYNSSCDIWALGIIAYFMAHAYLPFEGRTVDELKLMLKQGLQPMKEGKGPWIKKGNFSKEFVEFTSACLKRNTFTRPVADELRYYPYFRTINVKKKIVGEPFTTILARPQMNILARLVARTIISDPSKFSPHLKDAIRYQFTRIQPDIKKPMDKKQFEAWIIEHTKFTGLNARKILRQKEKQITFQIWCECAAMELFRENSYKAISSFSIDIQTVEKETVCEQFDKFCKDLDKEEFDKHMNSLFKEDNQISVRDFSQSVIRND